MDRRTRGEVPAPRPIYRLNVPAAQRGPDDNTPNCRCLRVLRTRQRACDGPLPAAVGVPAARPDSASWPEIRERGGGGGAWVGRFSSRSETVPFPEIHATATRWARVTIAQVGAPSNLRFWVRNHSHE